MKIETVFEKGQYRVVINGTTMGWIKRWYCRLDGKVNKRGEPRYSARPMGAGEELARHDCRTKSAAVSYIVHYHGLGDRLL